MRSSIARLIGASSITLLLTTAMPAYAQGPSDLEIRVNKSSFATRLGGSITFEVVLTNASSTTVGRMTGHLMIVDPEKGKPLDPEDWTSRIAQRAGPLKGGSSQTLRWLVRPVAEGTFAMFVVLVSAAPASDSRVQTSPVVPLSVGLSNVNSGPAIPVSVGVPLALGALQLTQLARIRRTRRKRGPARS